jgi:hypothetical protein
MCVDHTRISGIVLRMIVRTNQVNVLAQMKVGSSPDPITPRSRIFPKMITDVLNGCLIQINDDVERFCTYYNINDNYKSSSSSRK